VVIGAGAAVLALVLTVDKPQTGSGTTLGFHLLLRRFVLFVCLFQWFHWTLFSRLPKLSCITAVIVDR
jgi:hypothetical protein